MGNIQTVAVCDDVFLLQFRLTPGITGLGTEECAGIFHEIGGHGKGQIQTAAGVVPKIEDHAVIAIPHQLCQLHPKDQIAAVILNAAPFHIENVLFQRCGRVVALHQHRADQRKGQFFLAPQNGNLYCCAGLAPQQLGNGAHIHAGKALACAVDENVARADAGLCGSTGEIDLHHQRALAVSLNGDADTHIVGLGVINGTVGARGKILGVGVVARQHLVQQDFIKQGIGGQLFQQDILGGDGFQNGLQSPIQRIILGRAFQSFFTDDFLHILQNV